MSEGSAWLDATNLSAWIGEPIVEATDVSRANAAIGYAWTLVNTETGRDSDHWANNGVPMAVEHVVLAAAARGYTNPESWGYQRVDDWGAGGRPIEQLGMYLTPAEKGVLSRFTDRGMRGLGVIKTTRESRRDPLANTVPSDGGPEIWWYG